MNKDFDSWNTNKKRIESKSTTALAYPREVWWCVIGLNIGTEIDGKNQSFERPVIVVRVYNKEMMVVLPLTSKKKQDPFHHLIKVNDRLVSAKLTQMRVISGKRLSRKIGVLDKDSFNTLRLVWKNSL